LENKLVLFLNGKEYLCSKPENVFISTNDFGLPAMSLRIPAVFKMTISGFEKEENNAIEINTNWPRLPVPYS